MMSNKVYAISWIGDYENNVLGVYITLEKAKQELAKIANNFIVTSSCDDGLSFSTTTGAFYCIDETTLYT